VPKRDDALCFKINVGPCKRASFSLPKSSEAQELQKVSAVLRIRVELLRPNVSDDRFKLLERRRQRMGFSRLGSFGCAAGERDVRLRTAN
jgi:hypothetical protein